MTNSSELMKPYLPADERKQNLYKCITERLALELEIASVAFKTKEGGVVVYRPTEEQYDAIERLIQGNKA